MKRYWIFLAHSSHNGATKKINATNTRARVLLAFLSLSQQRVIMVMLSVLPFKTRLTDALAEIMSSDSPLCGGWSASPPFINIKSKSRCLCRSYRNYIQIDTMHITTIPTALSVCATRSSRQENGERVGRQARGDPAPFTKTWPLLWNGEALLWLYKYSISSAIRYIALFSADELNEIEITLMCGGVIYL